MPHIIHVLEDRRKATSARPLADNEVGLGHDFGSITDQGARIGAKAMARLEARLDDPTAVIPPKEGIDIAKLGITAAKAAEDSRLKGNDQKLELAAIFGLASGHLRIPAGEVDDDKPTMKVLRAALDEERRQLTELAEG